MSLEHADEIGSVTDAVEYLRRRLEMKMAKVVFYPEIKYGFLEKRLYKSAGGAFAGFDRSMNLSSLAAEAGDWLHAASELRNTPLAVIPELFPLPPDRA